MFRQISEVALDGVSAELQAKYGWHTAATGSIETLNPSPVAPQREGRDNALRMGETGKNGRAVKPGRVNREVVRQRSEADWLAISASLRTIRRNKCAVAPQGSPTLAAHLFLVIDHAKPPTMARTSRDAMTSRKPAKK